MRLLPPLLLPIFQSNSFLHITFFLHLRYVEQLSLTIIFIKEYLLSKCIYYYTYFFFSSFLFILFHSYASIRVRFTRCLYVMLLQQQFQPPAAFNGEKLLYIKKTMVDIKKYVFHFSQNNSILNFPTYGIH